MQADLQRRDRLIQRYQQVGKRLPAKLSIASLMKAIDNDESGVPGVTIR
jgi:hypothetical protein